MQIPEQFPIKRIENYHTHYLGIFENGIQFFATITDLHRKYWIVIYLFDVKGNHIDTKYGCSKIPFGLRFHMERMEELDKEVNKMIEKIGSFIYNDIIVKPFQIEIKIEKFNHIFGLIPSEKKAIVTLEPGNTIAFRKPWDGSYDT